jgi:DNA-binding NtrC family response regulator
LLARVFVIAAQKRDSAARAIARIRRDLDGTSLAIATSTLMSRILFVSHDADLRAAAARALSRAGWHVTTAAHGGHAWLACASDRFDVLVVEDEMPDGSGGSLASRLRCPALPVVRMCNRAAAAGEGIAVVRPFTADDLTDAILRAACPISAARSGR